MGWFEILVPPLILYVMGCVLAAVYVSTLVEDGERIPRALQWLIVALWPVFVVALLGALALDGLRAAWRWGRR